MSFFYSSWLVGRPGFAPSAFDNVLNPSILAASLLFSLLVRSKLPLGLSLIHIWQLWGALFFVFMSFAALSTIIAVFENLISWSMDKWNWTRKTAVARTAIIVTVLSLSLIHIYGEIRRAPHARGR